MERVIKGLLGEAKVFTDNIEETAIKQIEQLCDSIMSLDNKIRIMPDVHAGAGCTIGTTMLIKNKVCPNLVGVDIGCGMTVIKLGKKEVDCDLLDKTIRTFIPSGFLIREEAPSIMPSMERKLNSLKAIETYGASINIERAMKSIGTLGGGNHFIEVAVGETTGDKYLIIHSGSRNLGLQVAQFYQNIAYKSASDQLEAIRKIKATVVGNSSLAPEKRCLFLDVCNEVENYTQPTKELSYLEGETMNDYLHDISIIQEYATLNREFIACLITSIMQLQVEGVFETIHNYIEDGCILRKGAVSAKKDEQLLIPINMRDGSLLCIGKGNEDWNCSAPHGAGRVMSRAQARKQVNLDDFKDSMKDVYSTCVGTKTLDESPMAYKPMDEIINHIEDTVDVVEILKPIYNFKAD